MVDIMSKTCAEPECKIRGVTYNFENEKKGLYCVIHKKHDMINVITTMCLECNVTARWNIKGSKNGLYCSIHAKKDMIDIWAKRCIEPDCESCAFYNFDGFKIVLYCFNHKKENMIDIRAPRCKRLTCDVSVNKNRNRGYCLQCFIQLFPDEPVFRNYKTKERSVVEYVLKHFLEFSWIADKTIQDGCSRKRPDLLLDLGYQVLIIEVDENCHSVYDLSCETKRICLLSQDVGERPIVIIRFNPDAYCGVSSCWEIDGLGICSVKKSKQSEWAARLLVLENQITYWLNPNNKSEKILHVVSLFMT